MNRLTKKGKKLDGRTGVRYKSQRLIELVGGIVLRSYVPHGTKKIGRWVLLRLPEVTGN